MKLPVGSQRQSSQVKSSQVVKTGDMQTAKVTQIMLDSGNDKLNEAMKQLVDVRACKEKLQAKLMKSTGYIRLHSVVLEQHGNAMWFYHGLYELLYKPMVKVMGRAMRPPTAAKPLDRF